MKKLPPFAILTIIALAAALLLAVTNAVTQEPIAVSAANAADQARKAVLPTAEEFDEMAAAQGVDSLYVGKAGGEIVGYASTVTVSGFGGPIEVTVGVDVNGTVTGLKVGGSQFAETAGLGAKAKEPAFTDQFVGKSTPVTLKVDVDAISGATITSRAVTDGLNTAAAAIPAK